MAKILNKYGTLALAVFVVTFLWMMIGNALWLPTWPAFIIWSSYYLIGANKEAIKLHIKPTAAGAILGFFMIKLLSLISPGLFWQAVIVGIMAAVIILLQEKEWWSSISMLFIGLNLFFAIGDLLTVAVLIIVGFLMALLTDWLTILFDR